MRKMRDNVKNSDRRQSFYDQLVVDLVANEFRQEGHFFVVCRADAYLVRFDGFRRFVSAFGEGEDDKLVDVSDVRHHFDVADVRFVVHVLVALVVYRVA